VAAAVECGRWLADCEDRMMIPSNVHFMAYNTQRVVWSLYTEWAQALITGEEVKRIRWRAAFQRADPISRCCAGSASFPSPLAGVYDGTFRSGRVVASGGLPCGNQHHP
jgi:hypothetical protein